MKLTNAYFARRLGSRFVFALVAFALPHAILAGPIHLDRTFNNPQPSQYAYFGFSVNSFNGNLLVGQAGSQDSGAYLYDVSTGAQLLHMVSPDGEDVASYFGRSVVQIGQNIAVGDTDAEIAFHDWGSVYIFNGATGQPVRTIRCPDPNVFTYFGQAMASASGKLFVGANTSFAGNVYVFDPATGQKLGNIVNPNSSSSDFGVQLQTYQNNVFISAAGNSMADPNASAIYLYDGTTLQRKMTISSPNPQYGAGFGEWMDADETRGWLLTSQSASEGGEAYLFNANTGALLRTFADPEPGSSSFFGWSLAIVGNYAIVGAPFADSGVGAAYAFNINTGAFVAKIVNPSGEPGFARTGGGEDGALFSLGGRLIATNFSNPVNGVNSAGSVYIFSVPEPSMLGYSIAALASVCAARTFRRRR